MLLATPFESPILSTSSLDSRGPPYYDIDLDRSYPHTT
jgi:hypothetical protein